MKQKFNVQKMTCSACSAHVERAVENTSGVDKVTVNLLSNSMEVEYNEEVTNNNLIIESVVKAGYDASVDDGKKIDVYHQELKQMKKRIIVSFIFLVPLLYVSMGHMLHFPLPSFLFDIRHGLLMALLQLVLTIPICVVNHRYFKNGYRNLFTLKPNMDTLIALSSSAAIIYGLINTGFILFSNNPSHDLYMDLYYESAGTILTLVTLGKYFEAKSKRRTSEAINKLIDLTPKKVIILGDGIETEIDASNIKVDDQMVVKPGMIFAVDGVIIKGETTVDESTITGESIPVNKESGDTVTSATTNLNGTVIVKATTTSSNSTISEIIKLVEEASNSKAPIAALADKISYYFVPTVILISLVSFAIWMLVGYDLAFSLQIGISVLVISCPCALGLATPVAIMVGTGEAAKNGILVKSAEALQTAHNIDTIVLDKTGTITKGVPVVSSCKAFDITEDRLLEIAYALESNSSHPLSSAVLNYAVEKKIPQAQTTNFEYLAGMGIKAEIEGKTYLTGNKKLLKANGISLASIESTLDELSSNGETPLIYANEEKILGVIGLSDEIRETSKDTIDLLKKLGIKTIILTGDNRKTALCIGNKVNVDEVISEVLPSQKQDTIKELKSQGRIVAMVGDGINDSIALSEANVGIAIKSGSDIAIDSADIILVRNNLLDVYNAINLSKKVFNNVKMNLFWAFFYNIIGIPIAAGILYPFFHITLSPMLGSLAMSFSSVCVVLNALRIKNFKPTNKGVIGKMIKTIKVDGMMCNNCVKHVKEALVKVEGISNVEIDLKKKKVDISMEKEIADEVINEALKDAGYEASEYKERRLFFKR